MPNRLYQTVVHQMRDSIDRTIGVVDSTGTVLACSELGRGGEANTDIPVEQIARQVEAELSDVTVPLKVAVMGCVVNGLGEGREADVGIAGGRDGGVQFVKGQEPKKVKGDLADILIQEVRRLLESNA